MEQSSNPCVGEPMDLNTFKYVTNRHNSTPEPKHWGKRRVNEEARMSDIELVSTIHAIDTV